jgi:hypothetical protein
VKEYPGELDKLLPRKRLRGKSQANCAWAFGWKGTGTGGGGR